MEADHLHRRRTGADVDGRSPSITTRCCTTCPCCTSVSVVALAGHLSDRERRLSVRSAGFRSAAAFHLQVSEFVKLVIILLVARYLTDLRSDDLEIRDLLKLAGLVLVPTVLVLKQPDLGTALTYVAVLLAGVFLAGLRWKYMAVIAVVAVLVVPVDVSFSAGLSEGAVGQFHGSRAGSSGHGLSVDPVEDRGRRGRDVGEGSHQGDADPAPVSAGAATRILSSRRLPKSMGSSAWLWCWRCILC